jgi:Sulfotransferase domain
MWRRLRLKGQASHPLVAPNWPTVLHVTHRKAGSQWLRRILYDCAPERVVFAEYEMAQFLSKPVLSGMIYPTLYLAKEEFDTVLLPAGARHFVVIRDLRDTLVSWYFSLKVSHAADHPLVAELRSTVNALTLEEGLIWFIEGTYFNETAAMQRSWHRSGERLIRYEDLLERDEEILERILLQECGVPIERARLRAAIHANRFECLTGRARGTEDVSSHERKGIVGDWRNYFTDRVKALFKERFGALLLDTGYESTPDW